MPRSRLGHITDDYTYLSKVMLSHLKHWVPFRKDLEALPRSKTVRRNGAESARPGEAVLG